jgi:uncharacterized protein (DUF1015 family)
VTEIRPFPALVVRAAWADRVVSPMHDALRPEERAAIRASNPDSYLHVTRRTDDPDVDAGPDALAELGRAALARLLAADAFEEFPDPSCFVYRLEADGRAQQGIVAEVPVAAFAAGEVCGHEDVDPDRVEAIRRHLEAVPARSDPVAVMHRPDSSVARAIKEATDREPLLVIGPADGLGQTVWRLGEPDALQAVVAGLATEVLYVADGHHRVAASIAEWELAAPSDQAAILCVLFPTDELRVLAFNRLVRGPVDAEVLRRGLEERFAVEQIVAPDPSPGSFDVYANGRWLRAKQHDPVWPSEAGGLDVARLHRDVLGPILAVEDFDDPRLEFVPELVPVVELTDRCDEEGGALFLLCPPSVEELMNVADRGQVVAPKSTYFHPKPRSGVFLRLLG